MMVTIMMTMMMTLMMMMMMTMMAIMMMMMVVTMMTMMVMNHDHESDDVGSYLPAEGNVFVAETVEYKAQTYHNNCPGLS